MGSSPAHDQNCFCAGFSALCDFFSQIFLMSPKDPFHFFYFAKEWLFKNSQSPPFTFFGTMRLTGEQKQFKKIDFFHFFPHAGTVEENT